MFHIAFLQVSLCWLIFCFEFLFLIILTLQRVHQLDISIFRFRECVNYIKVDWRTFYHQVNNGTYITS